MPGSFSFIGDRVFELSSTLSRAIAVIALCICLGVLGAYHRLEASALRADAAVVESVETLYVSDDRTLRLMFLGYDMAAADLLWLRTVDYFGRHFTTDRRYPWLQHFVEQILRLDPQFRKVYHWAGANVLYGQRFTNETVMNSTYFYERALEAFPDDNEAAFRIGINYYVELRSEDRDVAQSYRNKGVQYLEMAANMPGAPERLRTLVVALYSRLGKNELAIQALLDLLQNTDDRTQRAGILEHLRKYEGQTDMVALTRDADAFDARWKKRLPYVSRTFYLLLDATSDAPNLDVPLATLMPDVAADFGSAIEEP